MFQSTQNQPLQRKQKNEGQEKLCSFASPPASIDLSVWGGGEIKNLKIPEEIKDDYGCDLVWKSGPAFFFWVGIRQLYLSATSCTPTQLHSVKGKSTKEREERMRRETRKRRAQYGMKRRDEKKE